MDTASLPQAPLPQQTAKLPPTPPWESHKKVLIIFGLVEMIFPLMALYLVYQLISLQISVGANTLITSVGLGVFLLSFLVALAQILIGLFNWENRFGSRKIKLLIILGVIAAVISIPAILLFIITPTYSLASSF